MVDMCSSTSYSTVNNAGFQSKGRGLMEKEDFIGPADTTTDQYTLIEQSTTIRIFRRVATNFPT